MSAPPPGAGRPHRRPLTFAFVLVVAVLIVEAVAGFWTGSLALVSDAGHMATDALGLGMALAAVVASDRAGKEGRRTYGSYRLEILAALANAVLLFGVAAYVLFEALTRIRDPIDVAATPMLVVAVVGLCANLAAWRLLRPAAATSLNVEGAFLEVVADLIGSIGVVAAALIVMATGWTYADPLLAAGIGLFILPRAWRLAGKAVRILVQAAPGDVDLADVRLRLAAIPNVSDVHDLHIWTLTSEMDVATVHLVTAAGVDPHPVLDEARDLLEVGYGIQHATLQVEPDTHEGCAELHW